MTAIKKKPEFKPVCQWTAEDLPLEYRTANWSGTCRLRDVCSPHVLAACEQRALRQRMLPPAPRAIPVAPAAMPLALPSDAPAPDAPITEPADAPAATPLALPSAPRIDALVPITEPADAPATTPLALPSETLAPDAPCADALVLITEPALVLADATLLATEPAHVPTTEPAHVLADATLRATEPTGTASVCVAADVHGATTVCLAEQDSEIDILTVGECAPEQETRAPTRPKSRRLQERAKQKRPARRRRRV